MDQINYDDFGKVEFLVGQIKECVLVDKSEKLLRMMVDFGNDDIRVVFSGIAKYYKPKDLLKKKTIFVTNVGPRMIMGEESQAMIFAASDKSDVSLLLLDKDVAIGSKVY